MMTPHRVRETVLTDTPDGTAAAAVPSGRVRASFERHVPDAAPPESRLGTAGSGGAS